MHRHIRTHKQTRYSYIHIPTHTHVDTQAAGWTSRREVCEAVAEHGASIPGDLYADMM